MLRKLFKGAFGLITAVVAAATDDDPVVTANEKDLACQLYGDDDFTHFNLTSLEKESKDSFYRWNGVEWKICEPLPRTNIFARYLDLLRGTESLTGQDYEPDDVQAIKDDDGNPWGVAITRQSENTCKSE